MSFKHFDIISTILIFILSYVILLLDYKINVDNYTRKKKITISFKVPIFISIVYYLLFKLTEDYVANYIYQYNLSKQTIITDLADF
jgi:hypothetical protein